jgi:DNA polymerase I-like protein with 3'-5' exonuclease and polymerase domains
MAIELQDDTNIFGDTFAAAPDIDRETLSRALYAQLKDVTLEEFVKMFTNSFEAVVDYANLCVGEKTGQRISLLFNPHRLDTGTKRFPRSLYSALRDPSFVNGLARVVLLNKKKGATKDLLYASVGMGVQGTSYVQEFPPHVARDLALEYGMSKKCAVLDPCAGWGGRMLGFSAVVNSYTCCEPSERTARGLRQLLTFVKSFRAEFNATINEKPFEDVELPTQAFDFAMTSPPYYDTEWYAPGEKTSSMNRYGSFTEWSAGFYAPLIHRTMRALRPGACFVINIGSRIYPLNEKLFEIAKDKYRVEVQKGKLSASNGLGKQGEGETFYEIKNPGEYVEPDALAVEVVTAHTAQNAAMHVDEQLPPFDATTLRTAPAIGVERTEVAHIDSVELSAATADSSERETAAASSPADAGSDFNPLDEFLSQVTDEPPKASANASDSAAQREAKAYENATQPAAVELPPAQSVSLSSHDVLKNFAARGHGIFVKGTKLAVTNSSQLSDEDRALIKEHRDTLLIIAPTFPEEQQTTQTIIQFMSEAPTRATPANWKLEPPPSLDGINEIEMDFETDGLNWASGAKPIGFSLRLPNGYKKYYPYRHVNAENLDEAAIKRWLQVELRGKRITNANTRFDVHMARVDGADLVEQGCSFSDVMHYAALLDDHRKRFAVNELAKDYLGVEKPGMDLDPTRMAHYEPWVVAQRAEGDVETVAQLKAVMWPLLDKEGLQQVRALEDRIIDVVVEMEKNGAPLNVELLHKWNKESEEHYLTLIREVSHEAGFNFDDSTDAWIELFSRCHLPIPTAKKWDEQAGRKVDTGKPTFKDAILERIPHPLIQKARFAAQLDSLRSKIYKPYVENVGSDGILRVEFNQLRIDDEHGKRGTVSGRFSAPYVQQVPNHDNHSAVFGELYFPRALYIARNGLFFAGDAAQIEYRIMASQAQNPQILQEYRENPRLSFHKLMFARMEQYTPKEFSYTNMKQANFMKIYGGGTVKTGVMFNFITEEEGDEISHMKAQRTDKRLAKTREVEAVYDRAMPEAKQLMKKAMHLAMPACNKFCNRNDELHKKYKHRGYVKTVLGRRSRFPNEYKIHKALNAVIQGSAADIMKTKLIEVFDQRKALNFTLRMTIHDEVCGDVPDVESAQRIDELLNRQSIAMAVPILWETGTGASWAEAK